MVALAKPTQIAFLRKVLGVSVKEMPYDEVKAILSLDCEGESRYKIREMAIALGAKPTRKQLERIAKRELSDDNEGKPRQRKNAIPVVQRFIVQNVNWHDKRGKKLMRKIDRLCQDRGLKLLRMEPAPDGRSVTHTMLVFATGMNGHKRRRLKITQ